MSELDVLRVRDETLQAMYWMKGEGLLAEPSPEELARFLAVAPTTLQPYLDRFVRDGYLESSDGRYRMSPKGEELGKRTFADEFAGMTGSGHGECEDDCWCHDSPEEAARCLEERAHAH